jgi:hypothetical protein
MNLYQLYTSRPYSGARVGGGDRYLLRRIETLEGRNDGCGVF